MLKKNVWLVPEDRLGKTGQNPPLMPFGIDFDEIWGRSPATYHESIPSFNADVDRSA
jgi:hypothetical protein